MESIRESSPMTGQNAQSPGSDVSPLTAPSTTTKNGFFTDDSNTVEGSNASAITADSIDLSERKPSKVTFAIDEPSKPAGTTCDEAWHPRDGLRRQSSTSSVTIQLPKKWLPQGNNKTIDKPRIRAASPKPQRFRSHVGFDNLPIGEATKNNIPSLTLNKKHKGYRAGRRSRTFMVGVDEHSYSDYALQWLLDELVDDGDEVVCVRVVEKEFRSSDLYEEEGRNMLEAIMEKNTNSKALSFVLEFASGKLHGTFQKLIQMHQPAMLIVGTRGRSLGGIQGLVNTRNSFSKYCLQYSPVPVVVVRPTEKRIKKKEKRANDAGRQTYISMLSATNGKHEADSEASSTYELETQFSADEEAHQVAKVLGLPASFDPTIKPLHYTARPRTVASPLQVTEVPEEEQPSSARRPSAGSESSDTEDEEGEGEFDVVPGEKLLNQHKMEKIHEMEVGEAAALRMPVEEDDESDDDSPKEKSTS